MAAIAPLFESLKLLNQQIDEVAAELEKKMLWLRGCAQLQVLDS
jgi:hypothetical protein